jgi:hypothetical protein
MIRQYTLQTDDTPDIFNSEWAQVLAALSRLNGDDCSRVVLQLPGRGSLIAGGGDDQRYIVIYTPENDSQDSLTLVDLSLQGSDIELTAEGVLGDYPQAWCVKKPMLISVFGYFYNQGTLPRDLRWEIENTGVEANLDEYF